LKELGASGITSGNASGSACVATVVTATTSTSGVGAVTSRVDEEIVVSGGASELVVVGGGTFHVEAWNDLGKLTVGAALNGSVDIGCVVADVGSGSSVVSTSWGDNELSNATSTADGDAKGQQVTGRVDGASLGESKALVLAVSTVEVAEVVVELVGLPGI